MAEEIEVAALFAKLGLEIDLPEWEKGEHKIKGLGGALDALGKVAVYAGATIAAVAVGVGYKLGEWFEEVGEKADKMSKDAQKTGIATEALQELAYAASLSDVSVEGLSHAIGHYSRSLNEATTKGTGSAIDAFKQLGVSMKQIKGETVDQNLEVIADAFAKMPDGAKKTALAMELFGRSGKDLIPLLNGGKKEIVELRNEAEELGIVVSGPNAKAFEKFNDDAKRVKTAWEGVKTQIAVALLPHLQRAVDVVLRWVKANREVIQQNLERAIEVVTEKATELYNFIQENWPTIQSLFQALGDDIVKSAASVGQMIKAIGFLIEGVKQLAKWLKPVLDIVDKIRDGFNTIANKLPGGGSSDKTDASGQPEEEDTSTGGTAKKWGKKAVKAVGRKILMPWTVVTDPAGLIGDLFSGDGGKPQSEGIPGVTTPPTIGTEPRASDNSSGASAFASNSFNAQITVNPSPGMNEKDLADKTAKALDEFWDAKMRQAHGDLQ